MLKKGVLIICISLLSQYVLAQDFLITDYGAKSDSSFVNTEAINRAVTACHTAGGGRVIIPGGVFLSGTIFMKDNVELHLSNGATLLAAVDTIESPYLAPAAYPSLLDEGGRWRAFIYANEASHISITGSGTIDGNGHLQEAESLAARKIDDKDGRMRNILFVSSNNILVEGVRMRSSGIWNQHYMNCEDVVVNNINVYNHSNRNNDGIDIDGCRRFVLSNSVLDTDDDAIVLKNTGPAATEDVVITNCIASSFCNAIKAGTESSGGFRNITISNCVIKPSRHQGEIIFGERRGIAGLSLEMVDGAVMEGVSVSNIVVEGYGSPLYIRLADRARTYRKALPKPEVGEMRNVSIDNFVAYGSGNYSASITGIPGHKIENLTLSNIQLFNEGGLNKEEYLEKLEEVDEEEKGYPLPTAWGNLPSSGLFIRHVDNIHINGLVLGSQKSDPRPPIVAEDVTGLRIKNIGRIKNNASPVFFYGENIEEVSIDKPLGWTKPLGL